MHWLCRPVQSCCVLACSVWIFITHIHFFFSFGAVFCLGMHNVSSRLGRTCSVRPNRQKLQPEYQGAGSVDLADHALCNAAINLNTCGHTWIVGISLYYRSFLCAGLQFKKGWIQASCLFSGAALPYRQSLFLMEWKWGRILKHQQRKSPKKRITIHLKFCYLMSRVLSGSQTSLWLLIGTHARSTTQKK